MRDTWKFADNEKPKEYVDCVVVDNYNYMFIAYINKVGEWQKSDTSSENMHTKVVWWMYVPPLPDEDDLIRYQSFIP